MDTITWDSELDRSQLVPTLGERYNVRVLKGEKVIAERCMRDSYNPQVTLPELEGTERDRVEAEIREVFRMTPRKPYW